VGADRLIRLLAVCVVLAGCAADDPVVGGRDSGRVSRISDGDTVLLRDGRRIRLVQIDAPEPGRECWGSEASREIAALLPAGTEVELDRDPALDDRDRFGRLLRYVSAAGDNVNVALVERGAAAPYFFRGERGRYSDELLDAAQTATAAQRGLWGACPAARLDPARAVATGDLR
jgi:micrococcal nuclease